jgi:hypothetical protein
MGRLRKKGKKTGRGGTLGQPEKNGPRGLGKRKTFSYYETFYNFQAISNSNQI